MVGIARTFGESPAAKTSGGRCGCCIVAESVVMFIAVFDEHLRLQTLLFDEL